MWIRTKTEPHLYVHELRGINYISWVIENDRSYSAVFPKHCVDSFVAVLQRMTGMDLEWIDPAA